jgi:hypothetical protein
MYFYNKLILSHKYEYYLLETWLNVKYFNWHVYCPFRDREVVLASSRSVRHLDYQVMPHKSS